ncbi:MAG: TolC family protein [Candidatus Muiribacteriaceae bacterium]
MKKSMFIFAAMFFLYNVMGMGLKDTLDYAFENSPEYRKIEIDMEQSEIQWERAEKKWHPAFSVSADDSDMRSVSVSQKISGGGSASYSKTEYTDSATESESVSIRQKITSIKDYDGIISRLSIKMARLEHQRRKKDFVLSVVNYFYDILKKQERLEIEKNSYKRWKNSYDYAVARFDSGSANKFSVLNAKLNLMNSQNSIYSQKDALHLALADFKKFIGFPPDKEYKSEDDIDYIEPPEITEKIRDDLRISLLSHEIVRINRKKAEYAAWPDISVSASASKGSGDDDFDWSTSFTYSFELGVSGDRLTYRSSLLSEEKSGIELEQKRRSILIEQEDYRRRLKTMERSITIKRENLKNAEESFEFSELSFQKGMISFIDLQDAQVKLTQAKQDYIFSLIDNRILILRYVKAFGGDPEGFIAEK